MGYPQLAALGVAGCTGGDCVSRSAHAVQNFVRLCSHSSDSDSEPLLALLQIQAPRAGLSIEPNTHPNSQSPGHFVDHMPSCLHAFLCVTGPVCSRGCGGTVVLPVFPSVCESGGVGGTEIYCVQCSHNAKTFPRSILDSASGSSCGQNLSKCGIPCGACRRWHGRGAKGWEGHQGAESAFVSSGTTAPLSRSRSNFSPAVR